MVTTDPISDFISNIKNAAAVGKEAVSVPYSKLKHSLADLLEKTGYVKNITKKGKKGWRTVDMVIAYDTANKSKLEGVERISKPSRRVYAGAGELPKVKNGFGFTIISTSKGVMTDDDARKAGLGGELLFKIW